MRNGRAVAAALFVYLGAFAFWQAAASRARPVTLSAEKPEYRRHELVGIRLHTRDPLLLAAWRREPPAVHVERGGVPVRTVADILDVTLSPEPMGGFVGRWPVPWNAAPGNYTLAFATPPVGADRLVSRGFTVTARVPRPVPQGFSVLTWESDRELETLRVTAPDGSTKDWRGLLDWVEYAGADAFWMLGGRTPGELPGQVWESRNLRMFPRVAAECRKRGIKFGLYAMCYLTTSSSKAVPGYEYALDVHEGRLVKTRAVSLRDAGRVRDIVDLLRSFRDIPGVDYLGLDYIRNALGGVELAEDFYAEMPGVRPPAGWARMSREERLITFARKKALRKDDAFVDAWQWWRAHRVGRIVERIRREVGGPQPLWAFTLTWDKGWHHGQDPVMMNDAGVDADALMFYEADAGQFALMMRDWSGYLRHGDAQLIVGDVVDWPLHQKHPDGPKEMRRRAVRAFDAVHPGGPARGVFIHDLARALWGRKGDWTTRQWLDETKAVFDHAKATRTRG